MFLFTFLSCVLLLFVGRGGLGLERGENREKEEGKRNLAIPWLYAEEPAHTIHIACQYFWSAALAFCGLPGSPSILLGWMRRLRARAA
jgi:hypothetical protein